MIDQRCRVWLACAAVLCMAVSASAQATRPAGATSPMTAISPTPASPISSTPAGSAPAVRGTVPPAPTTAPVGAYERIAIERSPAAGVAQKGTPLGKVVPIVSTGMDTTRVVLSLALVIVAIFLLRWIAQQFFGVQSVKGSSRAVQVLSRSMITPKQHVLVLQVGRRVIVVGDSGTQMNPLCEITDADEIASLMGQLRQDKTDPVSRAFGSMFGRAQKDYGDEPPDPASAERTATDPDLDPALATTQAELVGLIDKVRNVSKQIGQG